MAIIRDLQERADAQRAADEAWAKKVEEAQAVADGLAKKARDFQLERGKGEGGSRALCRCSSRQVSLARHYREWRI